MQSQMPDRDNKPMEPAPWERKPSEPPSPKRPDADAPDTKKLIERMRRVDPNQSKRYRQRTGQ